ncbi:hypothetical protein HNY73_007600 [Argiope bruennichi]|uniref:Uncharacterized protein n=1 Tax=Argiope bruennichi TaxID=94029 RepID=A0A8T0FHH5_ARGBR|nr:hypothetical protein HNY73_007600 [Argiope bruennichi]
MDVVPCTPLTHGPNYFFDNFVFNEDLRINLIKQSKHPELLCQLALEVIGGISDQALKIYTDGSIMESGRTRNQGRKSSRRESRHYFRNPDRSSAFRSELLAINKILDLPWRLIIPEFGSS